MNEIFIVSAMGARNRIKIDNGDTVVIFRGFQVYEIRFDVPDALGILTDRATETRKDKTNERLVLLCNLSGEAQ